MGSNPILGFLPGGRLHTRNSRELPNGLQQTVSVEGDFGTDGGDGGG